MHTKLVDPDQMTLSDISVDLNDYREIQKTIGNRSYEVIRAGAGKRLVNAGVAQ